MKKSIAIIFILLASSHIGKAQDKISVRREKEKQTLTRRLAVAKNDTTRVLLLAEFTNYYKFKRPDSALIYGYRALTLARDINFPRGEVMAIGYLGITQRSLGNYTKALQLAQQAIKIAEKNNLLLQKTYMMLEFAHESYISGNYLKALNTFKETKQLFGLLSDSTFSVYSTNHIGQTYLALNQPDSALYYSQLAYDNFLQLHKEPLWLLNQILLTLGNIQNKKGDTNLAMSYYKQSLEKAPESEFIFNSNFAIAQLFKQTAKYDSAIFYAKESIQLANEIGSLRFKIDANILLSDIYEQVDLKQALHFSQIAMVYKDSLNNFVNVTTEQTYTDFAEQERKREIEAANIESQYRLRMNAFLGSTFTLLVVAFLLFRNNRIKQKAKQNIEKAYEQLRSTQSQLIQSEKMASLGELTAGIAHEIQNPLNFVNNFSEVNKELAEELEQEVDKGNTTEVKALAKDIKENQEKILHHGKRADAIVKGMLQHSRSTSGVKEPTDINALADEYLRVAYHGLRAKDKTFNAKLETHLDPTLPEVNVVPQDIGRVILNLINNAFYAVNEKYKACQAEPVEADRTYEPTVTVSTKKLSDKIEIRVKDNGKGIPQKILDKIFQPFFTTKPTGQGTGLGLSLSYDIVKAHGGELSVRTPLEKVETEEGKGSEFIIQLPIV